MTPNTLALSRWHVLGDLHRRCDAVAEAIPVYLSTEGEPALLGDADQSLGHFADAFSFHLDAGDCKKLEAGQFAFSVDYEPSTPGETGSQRRFGVNC